MGEQVFMATNATRTIAATTTPMRAVLPGVARHARVYNAAPVIAYIRFGLNDMDASVSTSMSFSPKRI